MDTYYIDLVLACLGDAWKNLERAKGYAIRAGVPNTQRIDKLIAGSSTAMSVYTDYLRQATEEADALAEMRLVVAQIEAEHFENQAGYLENYEPFQRLKKVLTR